MVYVGDAREAKLDRLIEFVKIRLRKELGREPTEQETLAKLPNPMCFSVEEDDYYFNR